ncbi:MAG: type VII secretion protein EssC [Anaerorhabdus sp.]
MSNRYLVVIYDNRRMFFSMEKGNFSIEKDFGEDVIYSSSFSNYKIEFGDQNYSLNGETNEYDCVCRDGERNILVRKNVTYNSYDFVDSIVFGNDSNCDIKLNLVKPILIKKDGDNFYINGNEELFLNGKLVRGKNKISSGDFLFLGGELIFFERDSIKIRSCIPCALRKSLENHNKVNYEAYHRSPRFYHMMNSDSVKVDGPPAKPQKGDRTLIKLIIPPLMMSAVTVAISILIGRGMFVLLSVAATIMSIVRSVYSYFDQKKKFKIDTERRIERYQQYLTRKSIDINLRVQEEVDACNYHLLKPVEIIQLALDGSRRIFEKSTRDNDFLEVRLGSQTRKPLFKLDLDGKKMMDEDDELYDMAKNLVSEFDSVSGVGISIDLKKCNVGIVGTKELAVLIVKQFLLEIMTFHSYHDVQLLTIFDQRQLAELEWLIYSPSTKLEGINIRGLVYTEVLRDQILGSFLQILKDREQRHKENNDLVFAPHYIVTILSSSLIGEHPISEYFKQDLRHLGVSIIIVENEIESLKENIHSVVEIYSKQRSRLLIDNGIYSRKNFEMDQLPTDEELLNHARILKGYNHVVGVENGLPKTVTFLEMYEAHKVEQLEVAQRWEMSDSTKTLAVRLGVTGDDYVELNLHEKAHGPHGLVAGTTGSGKSEIVQSYILSLAINFNPQEVSFLLIDYKGGGMANLFSKLPHLIGTITNLDRDGSMRALASIKAELRRRQEIFSVHKVNHINQYIRLFKQGEAEEPMPHLFLISDEFAELKSEQPEFMAELVSTARIGRSLGIHLILATQKPSGVVDAQIWSNSKFKLCLKVQDAADSKEMLKTADAAQIVEPGRAYLQVGNNEIYELFQSAWSGADYYGTEQNQNLDKRVYVINRLGQHKLITKDLSGIQPKSKVEKVPTELEAIVDEVGKVYHKQSLKKVKPIWLKDLEERYYLDDYVKIDFNQNKQSVMLGKVDIPSQQLQLIYDVELEKMGNIAILGSSGYGKSFAMMTALLSLVSRNKASDVYAYVLDFGNNSLINLRNLPHVADYITVDDEEKLSKFNIVLTELVEERKKKFASVGANHISVYNRMVEKKLPSVIIALDNYDVVKEEYLELQSLLNKYSRDCTSLGIYFMFSALKLASFKMSMVNNFKTRVALYGLDKYDYGNSIGKSEFLPKEQPGSGLVRIDGIPAVIQLFLPASGEDDISMLKNLNSKIATICKEYDGEVASGIKVVGGALAPDDLLKNETLQENEIILGLDYETAIEEKVLLKQYPLLPILSLPEYGKTNVIRWILMQDVKDGVVLDGSTHTLATYKEKYPYYSLDKKEEFLEALDSGVLHEKIIITDAGDEFISAYDAAKTARIYNAIQENTLHLVIAINAATIKAKPNPLTRMIREQGIGLGQCQPTDLPFITITTQDRKEKVKLGDGLWVNALGKKKIRIPKVEEK